MPVVWILLFSLWTVSVQAEVDCERPPISPPPTDTTDKVSQALIRKIWLLTKEYFAAAKGPRSREDTNPLYEEWANSNPKKEQDLHKAIGEFLVSSAKFDPKKPYTVVDDVDWIVTYDNDGNGEERLCYLYRVFDQSTAKLLYNVYFFATPSGRNRAGWAKPDHDANLKLAPSTTFDTTGLRLAQVTGTGNIVDKIRELTQGYLNLEKPLEAQIASGKTVQQMLSEWGAKNPRDYQELMDQMELFTRLAKTSWKPDERQILRAGLEEVSLSGGLGGKTTGLFYELSKASDGKEVKVGKVHLYLHTSEKRVRYGWVSNP